MKEVKRSIKYYILGYEKDGKIIKQVFNSYSALETNMRWLLLSGATIQVGEAKTEVYV